MEEDHEHLHHLAPISWTSRDGGEDWGENQSPSLPSTRVWTHRGYWNSITLSSFAAYPQNIYGPSPVSFPYPTCGPRLSFPSSLSITMSSFRSLLPSLSILRPSPIPPPLS